MIKVAIIKDLAQNFLQAPRITKKGDQMIITYDYEMGSGEYSERNLYFDNVKDYRHTEENDVTAEIIEASYNSIAKVVDSNWINQDLLLKNYNHFIIYFDEYGAYEFVAKGFRF